MYNNFEKHRRLVKFFRNKKQLSNILNQAIMISLMLGFVFMSAPALAQTGGVGNPCGTSSTTTQPAESCSAKFGTDFAGTQFIIQGVITTTGGSEAGVAKSSGTTLCCCKSDPTSTQIISDAIGKATQPDGSILIPGGCPAKACGAIMLNKKVERGNFAPEPCGSNLSTDPLLSPLKDLSSFVSKWYAVFFYLAVVLAIIQIFRGGFEYAIAAGNSSKTEEAKGIIVEAVIGLGVAMLAAGVLVFLRGPQVFIFK